MNTNIVDLSKSYALYYSENVTPSSHGLENIVIDDDSDMWTSYNKLFTLNERHDSCIRFQANSRRNITGMNTRNLMVPIMSYNKNAKKYESPILCARDLYFYPAQLLTGADQALHYICYMTDDDKAKVIREKSNVTTGYKIDDQLFEDFDIMCDNAFIFNDYINNLSMVICVLICFAAVFQIIFDVQKNNISQRNKIFIIILQSVAFCFAGICIEFEIKYYLESSNDAWVMILLVTYVFVLNLIKRVIQYKANENGATA